MDNDLEQISRLRDLPLTDIGCPVLIVHGRADANVPFDHAEVWQRSLPTAELLAFDGGSHLLMLEPNARSANQRLVAFLSRCLE
jgi:pimeloyl-ACP methyl ester carboxylesterase